ncbi:uncharacterized protein CLAFUR5_02431 [Fulvia fulva]|uniref:Uncharacterized protein n=1 Tax=Passalora fulva TaxID=5499 RepID=A0A9Q8L9V9_PASFU|nr:uncharacterized protein CLAFUR5_02431 [Fulvia fulva]UJO13489.1 hypothetical protein CLAFUR5_02431 [Fulvia fulva]
MNGAAPSLSVPPALEHSVETQAPALTRNDTLYHATTEDAVWDELKRVCAEGRVVDYTDRLIVEQVHAAVEPLQRIGAFPGRDVIDITTDDISSYPEGILRFLKSAAHHQNHSFGYADHKVSYSLGTYRRTTPHATTVEHITLIHSDASTPMVASAADLGIMGIGISLDTDATTSRAGLSSTMSPMPSTSDAPVLQQPSIQMSHSSTLTAPLHT